MALNPIERAEQLFTKLIALRACTTYALAYEHLFDGPPPGRWTQAHANQVVQVAGRTEARLVTGLRVRLDALIVNGRTREPGAGHFKLASYTLPEWRAAFRGWQLLDKL